MNGVAGVMCSAVLLEANVVNSQSIQTQWHILLCWSTCSVGQCINADQSRVCSLQTLLYIRNVARVHSVDIPFTWLVRPVAASKE